MGDFDRNFDRRRSGGGRSDRNRPRFDRRDRGRDRRSERREMHQAICDKCGKDCEVPFKPTQGKPIYCDDCFKDKSREAGSRSEFGKPINNENFDQINKKLDKILKILEEPVIEGEKPKKIEEPVVEKEKPKKIEELVIEKEKPKKKAKKKK